MTETVMVGMGDAGLRQTVAVGSEKVKPFDIHTFDQLIRLAEATLPDKSGESGNARENSRSIGIISRPDIQTTDDLYWLVKREQDGDGKDRLKLLFLPDKVKGESDLKELLEKLKANKLNWDITIHQSGNGHVNTEQVELDEKGYIKKIPKLQDPKTPSGLNFQMATSVPGVFVAGDVHDYHYRQAITAAGFGCMAAMDTLKFLDKNAPSW